MAELDEIIRAEILAAGPMRFDRFMDLALNHPLHGYYQRSRERPRTGRAGDFFTSVSVGPMFGCLLARQFFQMWQVLGKPTPFWVVEQGAHDGQLACDILQWSGNAAPEFFEAMRYAIVEPSLPLRCFQQKKIKALGFFKQVVWLESIEMLKQEQPVGVFFSNELVDALPVRVITRKKGEWRERRVALGAENSLVWVDCLLEDGALMEAIAVLPLPVIEGYTTEINLGARAWMADVARAMKRGYVVTIDYGFPASIYYADFRMGGTLTSYLQHRRTEEVLLEPGSRDLTAHVDFTALAQAGENAGLTTLGFVDQQRFFMGVAHDELSGRKGPSVGIAENLRAWNTLTHPEHLGSRFQVLLQAKDAPAALDGLRFARPGGLADG